MNVLAEVLENHAELVQANLVVAVEVVLAEEWDQHLAQLSDFALCHKALRQETVLEATPGVECVPRVSPELRHGAAQRELAVLNSSDSRLHDLVMDGPINVLAFSVHQNQVPRESDEAHDKPSPSESLLEGDLVTGRNVRLVHPERRTLDDQVRDDSCQHDFGVFLQGIADGDTRVEQAHVPGRRELTPRTTSRIWRLRILGLALFVEAHPAENDG
mmetsp:Transcript_7605/g.18832  ORF Transcript_7605/g.18832 Transcript_7605/m.18832 type:complete len:216 (-) Transcript_7605:421-1068(-)